MKRYSIEWSGTITSDIGWVEVEAESIEQAKDGFAHAHGTDRRIRSVVEITDAA